VDVGSATDSVLHRLGRGQILLAARGLRQVDHRFGVCCCLIQHVQVGQPAAHGGRAQALDKVCRDVAASQGAHLVSLSSEFGDQRFADVPGSAGNEDLHATTFLLESDKQGLPATRWLSKTSSVAS